MTREYVPVMQAPHIGVIVDHPDRDLVTAAMIAIAMSAKGCVTSIIPLYEQGIDVPLLGLDAIVVNFLRPANRPLVEQYRKMGIAIFVLDTEGGILAKDGPNSPTRMAATVRDEGWREMVDGYFFWGPLLRDAFAESGAIDPLRLHLTGCPRFDPVAPRWRAMLDFPHRDFILVNTAFPLVNSRFTADGNDRQAMISSGWDAAYVDRLSIDSKIAMDGMIGLISRLARRFPDRTFLLRPHPFERAATYSDAFRELPNIIVSSDGSVLNAIAHASCVIQLNCSTAVESLMLDTLPLSPDFISTPVLRNHSELPNKASWLVQSEDALVELVSNPERAAANFPFSDRYDAVAKPYFFYCDGAAAERIAAVLAKVPVSAAAHSVSVLNSVRCSHAHPRKSQVMQGIVGNLIGSANLSKVRRRMSKVRKGKGFDAGMLAAIVRSACDAAGTPAPTVTAHRHPVSGMRLASLKVDPAIGDAA